MKNRYFQYTLKDLLVIKNGKDYKHLNRGTTPVYGTGGVMTYVDDKLYSSESILLPRKGTLNNIIYVNRDFWTVDTMYWTIIDTSKAYPKYLYSYLSLLDLSHKDSGSTLPSMTFDSYYSVPVILPDIKYQERVGDFIFSLISKIDTNSEIIRVIQDVAKTLYDYWFLQFDFPDEKGRPYKASGGKMVEDKEIQSEIPVGWKRLTLKEVVSQEKYSIVDGPFGTQMKIQDYVPAGIPIYEMDQLNGKFIVERPKHFISDEKYNQVKRSTVKNGDIVISKTGTLGLLGVVKSNNYDKGVLVSRLAKITPDSEKIGKYTLLIMLQHLTDSGYWMKKSGGSTMPILNNQLLENVPVLYSESGIFKKFEKIVTPFYETIFVLQQENKKLEELKNFLLPLLLSGQATIK